MNKLFDQLSLQPINKILMIGGLLTFMYWYFIYNDGSILDGQISAVGNELNQEEAKKKDTDATLKQVQEMQEKIGQLSQKYQEISTRLPSVLFSIDINKAIDDFARGANVSVKSKKPGDNIRREVVEEVPVDVSLEGTYAELAQFVYIVSNAERMARAVNIVMTPVDGPVRKLKLEGQVIGYKLAPQQQKTETPR